MIVAGTYPPINLGSNDPGMTLQYRDVKNGYIEWRDVLKDGETLLSPVDVDVDALPAGRYRLIY